MNYIQLPLRFDPERLHRDLEKVPDNEWVVHFNKYLYKGEWSAAALRSGKGDTSDIVAGINDAGQYENTPLLDRCPYFKEVMDTFQCPKQSVRLMKLCAGSEIGAHEDCRLDYEEGEVRIHVPVQTNPHLEFYLSGERVGMEEGESWYMNFNLTHRIINRGNADRIHLVMDCEVNDWLRDLFNAAGYKKVEKDELEHIVGTFSDIELDSMIKGLEVIGDSVSKGIIESLKAKRSARNQHQNQPDI